MDSLVILSHHRVHRFFQSIKGQFEHGKDLPDLMDGTGVRPFFGELWVDPDYMGEGLGDELQSFITGLSGPLFDMDGAIRGHQLVRGHARIPDDDEPSLWI